MELCQAPDIVTCELLHIDATVTNCEARLRRFYFFMNGINFKSGSRVESYLRCAQMVGCWSSYSIWSRGCQSSPPASFRHTAEELPPTSPPPLLWAIHPQHWLPPTGRGFKVINSFIPEEEGEENKWRSSGPGGHSHTQTISVIVTTVSVHESLTPNIDFFPSFRWGRLQYNLEYLCWRYEGTRTQDMYPPLSPMV